MERAPSGMIEYRRDIVSIALLADRADAARERMLKHFREPYQLLFLLTLRDGPVYGLKLADRIEEASKGHFRVSYGTIYPFLRRMEKTGLIESKKDDTSGRVYYELTPDGKRALKGLLNELDEHREDFGEKMLGLLAIYQEIFGRRGLNRLLNRIA
jgi:PadR family transcriptional regulator PadR